MKKQKWVQLDKDYALTTDKVVCRLHYIRIGVGSMGRAFSLRVRKVDNIEEQNLGYCFYTRTDGGYNSFKEDSVGGKVWTDSISRVDIAGIQKESEKILKTLKFI